MEARDATNVTKTCRREVLPSETNLGHQCERQNSRIKLECLAARLKQRAAYLSRSSTSTDVGVVLDVDENWLKSKSTNSHAHEQINKATIDVADWPNQNGQKAVRQRRPLQVQACTSHTASEPSQNDQHVLTLALEVKSAAGSDESSAKLTQLLVSADFRQECDSCVKASHRKLLQRNAPPIPAERNPEIREERILDAVRDGEDCGPMLMHCAKLQTTVRKAVKNATETKQHREERRPAANNS